MKRDETKGRFAGIVTLLLVAGFLAGCAADKEKIVFTDEATLPQLPVNYITPPKPSLPKADETKIELQVFGYLLTRHFWDDNDYSAIFLQGNQSEIEALQKQFPQHVPPIKPDYRVQLRPGLAPLDKDTGRLAMILSVDVNDPDAEGSVTAIGKWYAGGAVTGFYSFLLKKDGDDWVIQNGQ